MSEKILTQERLKELFYYNQYTGHFVRKVKLPRSGEVGSLCGTPKKAGYLSICIDRKQYYSHRLVWLYVYGRFPCNEIDHVNHVRTDNRIENLRDVTRATNNKNICLRKTSKTGVTGVYFCKQTKKWAARVNSNGKQYWLGRHNSCAGAEIEVKKKQVELGFHENHGGDFEKAKTKALRVVR